MVEIDPSGGLVTVDNLQDIKLGSVFPKANLAWRNAFDWKGVHLSALVTARLGGVVYSATQAAMDQYGVSESSAREGQRRSPRQRTHPCRRPDLVHRHRHPERASAVLHLQRHQRPSPGSQHRLHPAALLVREHLLRTAFRCRTQPADDLQQSAVRSGVCGLHGQLLPGIDYFMMPSTRSVGLNARINF